MPDKRDSLRYNIKARVSFQTEGGESRVFEGKVLDLGYLGWGIFLKESIAVNTLVQFDISVDFLEQHLIGKGKIVNVNPQKIALEDGFRIGVKFLEVDKDTIIAFVNENQRLINEKRRKVEAERKKQWGSTDVGPF